MRSIYCCMTLLITLLAEPLSARESSPAITRGDTLVIYFGNTDRVKPGDNIPEVVVIKSRYNADSLILNLKVKQWLTGRDSKVFCASGPIYKSIMVLLVGRYMYVVVANSPLGTVRHPMRYSRLKYDQYAFSIDKIYDVMCMLDYFHVTFSQFGLFGKKTPAFKPENKDLMKF